MLLSSSRITLQWDMGLSNIFFYDMKLKILTNHNFICPYKKDILKAFMSQTNTWRSPKSSENFVMMVLIFNQNYPSYFQLRALHGSMNHNVVSDIKGT